MLAQQKECGLTRGCQNNEKDWKTNSWKYHLELCVAMQAPDPELAFSVDFFHFIPKRKRTGEKLHSDTIEAITFYSMKINKYQCHCTR